MRGLIMRANQYSIFRPNWIMRGSKVLVINPPVVAMLPLVPPTVPGRYMLA